MATTTHTQDHGNTLQSLLGLICAPFRVLDDWLFRLAESGRMARELNALNQLSDDDLAARGKTRAEEARRIVGLLSPI